MSIPVKEVMTAMPHTIGHDIAAAKAQAMMAEYNCHHLPVLDGGKLVGVISNRDLAIVAKIPNGEETPVEDLMTDEPIVVDPDTDIHEVVATMLKHKIHSVIVSAKEGHPWGICTSTNALQYFVDQK
ncbi:MAG: CBS domain-containing protein [Bdellovibrionales bacterium]|nr:CBS domain-containing protein [Bdellovibrionales bacterium]